MMLLLDFSLLIAILIRGEQTFNVFEEKSSVKLLFVCHCIIFRNFFRTQPSCNIFQKLRP